MPLAKLVNVTGWREASFILALVGVVLAGLLWRYVRDYPDGHRTYETGPGLKEEWTRLVAVCGKMHTWLIGGYAFTIWTPIAVFAALWGVPFLQARYDVSVVVASGMCSLIWIGIGIGSPLLGWLSDRMDNRRFALGLSAVFGLIASLFILYDKNLSFGMANFILLILGLGAGGQSVSFAVVRDYNPPQLVGTAAGVNNLAVLIGGSFFTLVGVFLHRSQDWHIIMGFMFIRFRHIRKPCG